MNKYKILLSFIIILVLIGSIQTIVFAQSIDELKSKINDRNDAINKLEQEIQQYQSDIEALGKEKDSLSNTIKSLDINKKKLQTDTKITENKIANKNLEIKELSLQIGDKSERITDSKKVISKSFNEMNQMSQSTIVENIVGNRSFSDIWKISDELTVLQGNMQDRIKELENLKVNLEQNKKLTEKKKSELILLTNDLKNQTKIIADTVKEKNSILAETKNTESSYKNLLALKKAQKEAFEREVADFESALKIAIDPNSIPNTGTGVLKYPLDKIKITQYFGNSEFATKNPQIYNGQGHTGVDFAASIGTPVKAALSGIIIGTGNTDVGNCRSYGKWVMIKHSNGLSTLYAHLSLINVSIGQPIATGDLVGYSGNTGYSTGPHLHFGVYATEGVNITKNKGSKYCSTVNVPYASRSAYLNPLSYL